MSISEAKVYFDGSHYIAIPYLPNPQKRGIRQEADTLIDVPAETDMTCEDMQAEEQTDTEGETENTKQEADAASKPPTRKMTRKTLFEELYAETAFLPYGERAQKLFVGMRPFFQDDESTTLYVRGQMDRKKRNFICRRTRLIRKINLQEFHYFCTFTYDDAKHTEETFRAKLKDTFKKMCYRRKWKYVGVWERSPEKQRLHFHGLFHIPPGAMPGELVDVKDYSPILKRVQVTHQNTYFNERFGRSDFREIEDRAMLGQAVTYILKYLEKSGEKIVYSRGLPQFFISDILEEDVVCTIGIEDRKLLLFDDFSCVDNGTYIGTVSAATIEKMRKCN